MSRRANERDLVSVMYEQVDALRRTIGVAPIRLARDTEDPARLKVSVRAGMARQVPTLVTLSIRREEVEIPLLAVEDYD